MSGRSRTITEFGAATPIGGLATPWSTAVSWTDISGDVVEWSTGVRGRASEFAGLSACDLNVKIDGSGPPAGTYDPENVSSSLYPNWTTSRRIRVREQVNLITLAESTGGSAAWVAGANTTIVTDALANTITNVTGVDRLTATAGGSINATTAAGTAGFRVNVGEPLKATVWLKAQTTGRTATLGIRWYTAAGATVSTTTGSGVADITGGWTKVTVTGTAPATAAFGALILTIASASAAERHYMAAATIVPIDTDLVNAPYAEVWFAGGPWPIFDGIVETIDPEHDYPEAQTVVVDALDAWAYIAAQEMGDSIWSTWVTRSKPDAWWRLGDADTIAVDSVGVNNGTYVGGPVASESLVTGGTDGGHTFSTPTPLVDPSDAQYMIAGAPIGITGKTTVAVWIRIPPGTTIIGNYLVQIDGGVIKLQLGTSGYLIASAPFGTQSFVPVDMRDGQRHCVVMTFELAAGVEYISINIDGGTYTDSDNAAGGAFTSLRTLVGDRAINTEIDEVVVWTGRTSFVDAYSINAAGRALRDLKGDVVAKFLFNMAGALTLAQLSSPSLTTIATAQPVVSCDATDYLSLIEAAAVTGRVTAYVDGTGTPQVAAIGYTNVGTLGGAGYPTRGRPSAPLSAKSVLSDVSAQRPNRSPVIARNSTTASVVGARTATVSTLSGDADALQVASWIVNQYSTAVPTIAAVVPDTTRVDVLQWSLQRQIGDLVSVSTTASGTGTTTTRECRIIGIQWAKKWPSLVPQCVLSLAPVRFRPFVLDDATYGILDTSRLGL